MKRFLALFFVIIMVTSLVACKKVEQAPKTEYGVQDLASKDKNTNDEYTIAITAYDRAKYFYDEYTRLVKDYGEISLENGNLKGVAVVRLIDFQGNGNLNMYVAYADGTKPYVNKQMVYGFDNGGSPILNNQYVGGEGSLSNDITSKATADADVPSVWLYTTAGGRGYIVSGDNMTDSPVFNTYFQTYQGESMYNFQKETGAVSAGTFEKIELTGLSDEDFEAIKDITLKVVDSLKATAMNKPSK